MKEYSIGPLVCEKCGNTTLHYYVVDRPLSNFGDVFLYLLVKTHKVYCRFCGREYRASLSVRQIAGKLQRAGFFKDHILSEFETFICNEIAKYQSDLQDDDIESIVRKTAEKFSFLNMEYWWFQQYVVLLYLSIEAKKDKDSLIYK